MEKESKKPLRKSTKISSVTPLSKKKHGISVSGKEQFYIVGMGGSAGSLEAFDQFFRNMPEDSGAAFVLISHLDPTQKGMLPELLQRYTKMKVFEAVDGMKVVPNCVYVIPSNKDMAILHGTLQLLEPTATRGLRLPIDFFFKNLGLDQKEKAVGIIISGMGSDGTAGLKTIKEHRGMVMVEDPESAKYDSMPRSAIDTGLADYIAPAKVLPTMLLAYIKQSSQPLSEHIGAEEQVVSAVQKILVLLRGQTGNDFSLYKKNTVLRRIERRMNVHHMGKTEQYVRFLQDNPQEVELLFKELLIGVTSFFRDPEAFEFLKKTIVPDILKNREKERAVRVWVPGCSTGEEAYSIAIIFSECLSKLRLKGDFKIQIFATDIDKAAIDKARQGVYPANIAADLSPERLEHFFSKEDNKYQINKDIREMVVFAPHNVTMDPPFTRLDLISCRNLLIYLTADLQKKLMALFHYSLMPDGILFLGTSETIGRFVDQFSTVDTKWKIYQQRHSAQTAADTVDFAHFYREAIPAGRTGGKQAAELVSIPEVANRMLLEDFTPAAVFINEQGDVVYIHGRTGKYLEPPAGKTNINIFAMAREGLKIELPGAIREAKSQNKMITLKGIKVKTNGDFQTIDLTVKPVVQPGIQHSLYMLVFENIAMPPTEERTLSGRASSASRRKDINIELENELKHTKELLQNTSEEMQLSQEELKSTNEEMQSTNEELQSTNEELSSSKEEMQSLNEEMMTVNAELQVKVDELTLSNSDMKNLLNRTEIATIFLDDDLNIRRFTPEATGIFNLIQSDIGRPISHIVSKLQYDDIVTDVRKVLDSLMYKEAQVQAKDGHWYIMRIMPYRTHDNAIDGVVINFIDITTMKKLEISLQEKESSAQKARALAEGIIATVREPLIVLDANFKVITANPSFYQNFRVTPEQTENHILYELGNGQWDIPELRRLLEEILPQSSVFNNFAVDHEFPSIGRRKMLLNASKIVQKEPNDQLILLAIEDTTGRRCTESVERQPTNCPKRKI
ncbi:MAG: CheR family methyltransferase [Dissulfurispiraceae bacterium]